MKAKASLTEEIMSAMARKESSWKFVATGIIVLKLSSIQVRDRGCETELNMRGQHADGQTVGA